MKISGDSWYTIKHESTAVYKESGSKFIAMAFGVSADDGIKDQLEKIRKKYFDATHICYAYILGREKKNFKAHDAGEPKHTAGDPILSQIRSCGLTDVMVVVVRYFGGKKLGRSGLTNAYKTAARSALEVAGREERIPGINLKIKFDAAKTGEMVRVLNINHEWILSSHFENNETISVQIRESRIEQFREELQKIPGISILTHFI